MNAAQDPEFKKYSLTGIAQIQLLPADLSTEAIEDIKTHFLTWVVGCGLRELIETFGVFLDQIFQASYQIAIVHENYNIQQAKKDLRKFHHEGVATKLARLRDLFDIGPKHPGYIESINQARNCLTHRRGIVGYRDCNGSEPLVIKWLGVDMIITTNKGEEILLDLTSKEDVYIEDGGIVGLRFVERAINYPLGHLVSIPPKALAEICFFMIGESKETLRSAVDYARRVGVQMASHDPRP